MKHLSDKLRKHENTKAQMFNSRSLVGRIRQSEHNSYLDDSHRIVVRKRSEEVDKTDKWFFFQNNPLCAVSWGV